MTEHVTLRFDWDETHRLIMTEVLGLNAMKMNDGSARWDAVAICLGEKAVLLTVEEDTDEVNASFVSIPSGKGWAPIPSFAFAQGQELGWCWVGTNYLGYEDCFSVAFGENGPEALTPRCMFYAVARGLYCYDLTPRMA